MGIFIIDEIQGVKRIGVGVGGGTVQIIAFDELSAASYYVEIGVNVRARFVTVNLEMWTTVVFPIVVIMVVITNVRGGIGICVMVFDGVVGVGCVGYAAIVCEY
mmetsp:Transcript_10040/g.11732  ORF Transcript_10040/g.11732 Transcript_10040/m.11732 type:complete len:104 (+) Transcript_10040:262-573(+)